MVLCTKEVLIVAALLAECHRMIARINNHDPSKTPQDTDITRHLTNNTNHIVCFKNPIILDRSDHRQKLLIKDTLMIQQRNPDLNFDKDSIPLY